MRVRLSGNSEGWPRKQAGVVLLALPLVLAGMPASAPAQTSTKPPTASPPPVAPVESRPAPHATGSNLQYLQMARTAAASRLAVAQDRKQAADLALKAAQEQLARAQAEMQAAQQEHATAQAEWTGAQAGLKAADDAVQKAWTGK